MQDWLIAARIALVAGPETILESRNTARAPSHVGVGFTLRECACAVYAEGDTCKMFTRGRQSSSLGHNNNGRSKSLKTDSIQIG